MPLIEQGSGTCRADACCERDDLAGSGFGGNFTSLYECTVIQITTEELDRPSVGNPYSFQLEYEGGTEPVTWSIESGELPNGLTLSTSGLISGTPTVSGEFSITVKVEDANENFCRKTLGVRPLNAPCSVITITTTTLPDGDYGDAYSEQLLSAGGTGPNTWTIISGALPGGLSLSTSGLLVGTPTESGPDFTFTVQVTDANGEFCTQELTLVIAPDFIQSTLSGGIIPFWVYAPNTDELHAFGIQRIIDYVTPASGAAFTSNIAFRAVYNPLDGLIYGGQSGTRIISIHDPTTGTDSGTIDLSGSLTAGGALNHTLYAAVSDNSKYLVIVYYAGGANSRIVILNATSPYAVVAVHTVPSGDPYHGIIYGDTAYIGSVNVLGRIYKLDLLSPATAPTVIGPIAGLGSGGAFHPPALCSVNGMIYWPWTNGTGENKIVVFDPNTDTLVTRIEPVQYWPSQCIDFPVDGKIIASFYDTRGFRLINPLNNTIEADLGSATFGILVCCIMAPNGRVFGGVGNGFFGAQIAIVTSTTPYP